MLPGKVFSPEEILQIVRRRIWWILVPFAVISAGTAVGVRLLPDQYRSETVILVVPQRIPESYVRSTVTTRIEDRLQSITQQILGRTRLEGIIQEFNLYPQMRAGAPMEDVVEHMRTNINVRVARGDAFTVSYVGDNAAKVQQVVKRLADLFTDENLKDRSDLAVGTNEFLDGQLADARRQLVDHEQKLEAYRKQYAGELPSQYQSNLQIIQSTEMQVQSLAESMNRDQDRRLLVQRQLEEADRQLEAARATAAAPSATATADGDDPAAGGGTIAEQLAAARANLTVMERRYKPDHPNLRRMYRIVSDLEAQAEIEIRAGVSDIQGDVQGDDRAPLPLVAASPEVQSLRQRATDLRAEVTQIDQQLASKQEEQARLRGIVADHQQRVANLPTRESQMAELTRDYATLQTLYNNMLAKAEESRIAADLERLQIGEQFKVLDQAREAERPVSPNREAMTLLGMAAGLGAGILLVAVLLYLDRGLKTDAEVTSVLSMPVLAVVPSMETQSERRRVWWHSVLVGCGFGSVVAACMAVVAYTFVAR